MPPRALVAFLLGSVWLMAAVTAALSRDPGAVPAHAASRPQREHEEKGAEEVPPQEPPRLPAGNPEDVLDAWRDHLLAATAATNPPGTDTNLCMSWEVSAAADPNNPRRLAIVQGSTLGVSTDGGDNFTFVSVGSSLPPGFTSAGDGTAAYDRAGRLFVAILGNPTAPGGWKVFVSRHDPVTGALVSGPVNVSAAVGLSPSGTNDKPWIAADAHPGSQFANRVYVVWSVTGGTQSGKKEIWGARSSDQGATWSQMTANGLAFGPISPLDASDGSCWPPHVAVGRTGDVYVAYHGQPGTLPDAGTPDGVSGKIVVLRSTDGGVTFPQHTEAFPPGTADATSNIQDDPGTIADARFWTYGTRMPWVLPDPADACTLHVVTTDDPDNDPIAGDPADVVMATSHDCGATWPLRRKVSDAPTTFASWQLLPTAAIDPTTGAIAVAWLDSRDAASYPSGSAGNARVDLRVRYSLDGGTSWLPSRIVNDVPIDPDASTSTIGSGMPPTYRIGEYDGVAFAACTAHLVWAAQGTCNAPMDTYYDRDPAVGDLDAPAIACPADVVLGCNDSTAPGSTGSASARDDCDPAPAVSFVDHHQGGSCPPTPVIDSIERIWSTRDAAGNLASCSQQISIQDFAPPAIDVPQPLVLECSTQGGVPAADPQIQGWLAAAGAVDSCSTAQLGISGVPALFPVGCAGQQTFVTFSASDACGNADFQLSSVSVHDSVPPTLVAPAPQRFECRKPGGTPRDDPQVAAWLAGATSSDVCSVPVVSQDAPSLLPGGCNPGASTVVHFTSTDGCGNQRQAQSTATVADTVGPVVAGPVLQQVLAPPDHQYRCTDHVAAAVSLADACNSLPLGVAIACSSSQCDDAPCSQHPGEDGDGSTVNDCTYDPILDRLCARAERAETDPAGRVYTVSATASDGCGNLSSQPILRLYVPHGCAEGAADCLFDDGFEAAGLLVWSARTP